MAARAGLFKLIFGALLAGKKFVLLALAGAAALVVKPFRRNEGQACGGVSPSSGRARR